MGRTQCSLCPVAAVLRYLVVRPAGDGPLLIFRHVTPLIRERFMKEVKSALQATHIDHRGYYRHSFRIGTATSLAVAGVLAYVIKMLGRWNFEAYQLSLDLLCLLLQSVIKSDA